MTLTQSSTLFAARKCLRAVLAFAGVLLVSACAIPTEAPHWDLTFFVPSKTTTLTVNQLLPGTVTTVGDNSAFIVSVQPITFTQTLGQMCGTTCTLLNGTTVPKPAFTATFTGALTLPSDVMSATLMSGSVGLTMQNNLSFDPIRPSNSARGSMTIEVRNGTTVLGSSTINGSDTAFPPGGSVSRTIALSGGAIGPQLTIAVTVTSPAGDAVTINTNQGITVTATPTNVRVSSAMVRVTNRTVAINSVNLNLQDVDQSIVNRVQGGTLVVDISNPFGVTGPLTIRINAPNNISKPVTLIGVAQQRVEIAFTAAELRSFLGVPGVVLSASGTVNGPANGVTVAPAQVVTISTNFRLILSSTES